MAQPQDFRERIEELERASLSTWATLSLETKGRDRYESDDPLRTVFQADRDRITGSGAWAALAGKAAAQPARPGRTRLEEATDVVRLARTAARALRLNEDLTEAVALGHALGATPFGPAGEEGLALATGDPYRREEQALRVVERIAGGGAGLNLTWETRDGILHQHWEGPVPATPEGDVARHARRFVDVSLAIADVEHVEALASGAGAPVDAIAEARQLLGMTHDARLERLALELARAAVEQPELRLPVALGELLDRAGAAADARRTGRPAALDAHARAVHCTASLAVFSLADGVAADGPVAGSAAHEVVDAIAACTDIELLRRYRLAFEPQGGATG